MVWMFRLFLIALLFAGSVQMAPMRGQMAGAAVSGGMAGLTQIEICSEYGVETVLLDASGQPVVAHGPCPDCIACHAVGLPDSGAGVGLAQVAEGVIHPRPAAPGVPGLRPVCPAARDPPRWV